jgi:hypothetical protein
LELKSGEKNLKSNSIHGKTLRWFVVVCSIPYRRRTLSLVSMAPHRDVSAGGKHCPLAEKPSCCARRGQRFCSHPEVIFGFSILLFQILASSPEGLLALVVNQLKCTMRSSIGGCGCRAICLMKVRSTAWAARFCRTTPGMVHAHEPLTHALVDMCFWVGTGGGACGGAQRED